MSPGVAVGLATASAAILFQGLMGLLACGHDELPRTPVDPYQFCESSLEERTYAVKAMRLPINGITPYS